MSGAIERARETALSRKCGPVLMELTVQTVYKEHLGAGTQAMTGDLQGERDQDSVERNQEASLCQSGGEASGGWPSMQNAGGLPGRETLRVVCPWLISD